MKNNLITWLTFPLLTILVHANEPATSLAKPSQAAAIPPISATSPLELSLNSSVGYDSNVYCTDQGPLGRKGSGVATVGAKIGAKVASGASINYTPTATNYWDETSQDNVKNVLGAGWKNKVDAISWIGTTEFTQITGPDTGSNYGPAGSSSAPSNAVGQKNAYATAAPRDRSEQLQNKTDLAVRFDSSLGFVRGVGKLQYWDMQTSTPPAPSTAEKYVDRSDINGGLDVGRAFTKGGPEYYLGYRKGYQFQDRDGQTAASLDASNRYDRYLIGVDGKLLPQLKMAAQVGTERHQYDQCANEDLFADITATWTISSDDGLTAKISQARGLSSTGVNSILVTAYELAWKHSFSKDWSSTLTARMSESAYQVSAHRDDTLYTGIAALTWYATPVLSCTLTASQDAGSGSDNYLYNNDNKYRNFDRTFVALGVNYSL